MSTIAKTYPDSGGAYPGVIAVVEVYDDTPDRRALADRLLSKCYELTYPRQRVSVFPTREAAEKKAAQYREQNPTVTKWA